MDKDNSATRSTAHPSRRDFVNAAAGAGIAAAGLALLGCERSLVTPKPLTFPTAMRDLAPFKGDVPQADLDDLKNRLANNRWQKKKIVVDWCSGVPLTKTEQRVASRDDNDYMRSIS